MTPIFAPKVTRAMTVPELATYGRRAEIALRVTCHLIAEVPLLMVAILQLSNGWAPTSDDAVIAYRSWTVFSAHPPLVGQFTQLSLAGGHLAFDPGPMQYFALAIPVRLDPVGGALWGSALLCAALVALAIEAAWSVGRSRDGALTAVAGAVITATLYRSTLNLVWNPSLGLYALFATLILAIAVGSGRVRWLPIAVVTASLAVQCHLSFALAAVLALAAGSVIGIAATHVHGRPVGRGILVVAGIAGAACWAAPIVQQLTGHPGNLSTLATSIARPRPVVGIRLGLGAIAAATRLPPSWWQRPPALGTLADLRRYETVLYGGSAYWAVAVLAVSACLGISGALRRRFGQCALGTVAAVAGISVAYTLGAVPSADSLYLDYYLYLALWPTGMLLVASLGVAVGELGAGTARRLGAKVPRAMAGRLRRAGAKAAYTAVLLGFGAFLVALEISFGTSGDFLLGWQPVHDVTEATAIIARGAPRGEFAVKTIGSLPYVDDAVSEGVAYQLLTRGLSARLTGNAALLVGPSSAARAGVPTVVIQLTGIAGQPVRIIWHKAVPYSGP